MVLRTVLLLLILRRLFVFNDHDDIIGITRIRKIRGLLLDVGDRINVLYYLRQEERRHRRRYRSCRSSGQVSGDVTV